MVDLEKKIKLIEENISELKDFLPDEKDQRLKFLRKLRKLKHKKRDLIKRVKNKRSSWDIVQISRMTERPKLKDYLNFFDEFIELHGDKKYGEDCSILTGFARISNERFMLVGNNKGRNLKENLDSNFGCAYPEGYRKAIIKMKLAEKFKLPIVSLIDTPGAYPGIESEKRGQAIAIAESLKNMANLKVPIISVVIGEGGSGGALGIGLCDKLGIMENSYYSVISPEGCSSILFKDKSKVEKSAESLKLTPNELYKLGLVDEIIKEPLGGAHSDYEKSFNNLKKFILKSLNEFKNLDTSELLNKRYNKYRDIGFYKISF